MDLPEFPLFKDPVGQKSIKVSDEECVVCGQRRGWVYACNMYGNVGRESRVCPWCIADGSVAEALSVSFNEGDRRSMTPEDVEQVERRTPSFVTWQEVHWQSCCDRACVYLGEAKEGDLVPGGRWAEAGETLFDDMPWPAEQKAEMLAGFGRGNDPAAYVFQCVVCGAFKAFWDCS